MKHCDESDYIDVIDSAKSDWFEKWEAAHPNVELLFDEHSDEAINRALDLPASGSCRGLENDLADWSDKEIRQAVFNALSEWQTAQGVKA